MYKWFAKNITRELCNIIKFSITVHGPEDYIDFVSKYKTTTEISIPEAKTLISQHSFKPLK